MTEINNRIEEVKKILDKHKGEFICNGKYQDITNVTIAKEIDDYYCQLFPQPLEATRIPNRLIKTTIKKGEPLPDHKPQPLDDKELREKIKEAIRHRNYTGVEGYDLDCIADQILALLQPKTEEAKIRETWVELEKFGVFPWK